MSMFRNILMSRQPGKSYVPGLVAAWKTYGKRNDDADRDDLYDYSGNGRDIELYNFAFSGMSGYGGYGSALWSAYGEGAVQVDATTVRVTQTNYTGVLLGSISKSQQRTIKYKISGYKDGCHLTLYTNTRNSEEIMIPQIIREITGDGVYEDTAVWDAVNAANDDSLSTIFLTTWTNSPVEGLDISIEQLPLYPGALVSDGIDDYGKCIKQDFALTDFTVCVIRRFLGETGHNYNAPIVGKVAGSNSVGAFLFEQSGNPAVGSFAYGNSIYVSSAPELFSYLTPTNFNGTEDSDERRSEDSDKFPVMLFGRPNTPDYRPAALYDLRIYDHSLTTEELQTVKDEMMQDYENATGGGYN